VIEEEGLVERAARLGEQVLQRLGALAERLPDAVEGVRGIGLLIGLVLRDADAAARIHGELRDRGLLVNLTAERVLRLFPALNIPEDELERGLELMEHAIESG
jgi:acetylornithine/succinyldiaminopimelate/putrescine aminotransferase